MAIWVIWIGHPFVNRDIYWTHCGTMIENLLKDDWSQIRQNTFIAMLCTKMILFRMWPKSNPGAACRGCQLYRRPFAGVLASEEPDLTGRGPTVVDSWGCSSTVSSCHSSLAGGPAEFDGRARSSSRRWDYLRVKASKKGPCINGWQLGGINSCCIGTW